MRLLATLLCASAVSSAPVPPGLLTKALEVKNWVKVENAEDGEDGEEETKTTSKKLKRLLGGVVAAVSAVLLFK